MRKKTLNLIVNIGLLFSGVIMLFSGLLLQVKYHIGQHGNIDGNISVYGIDYSGWTDIHKISIIFVTVLAIYHIIQHWKWYKTVIKKKLLSKNRQVFLLTVIFFLVAVTGYIPWIIKLAGGDEIMRKIFVEIHDKLAIILSVFLIIHILKRVKWYVVNAKVLNISNFIQ